MLAARRALVQAVIRSTSLLLRSTDSPTIVPPLLYRAAEEDLERMAASTAYWKGLQLRGNPRREHSCLSPHLYCYVSLLP